MIHPSHPSHPLLTSGLGEPLLTPPTWLTPVMVRGMRGMRGIRCEPPVVLPIGAITWVALIIRCSDQWSLMDLTKKLTDGLMMVGQLDGLLDKFVNG